MCWWDLTPQCLHVQLQGQARLRPCWLPRQTLESWSLQGLIADVLYWHAHATALGSDEGKRGSSALQRLNAHCYLLLQGLIAGVLLGLNTTVFAYGATGSGKTYTMVGTPTDPGIMVLSMSDIFAFMVRSGPCTLLGPFTNACLWN